MNVEITVHARHGLGLIEVMRDDDVVAALNTDILGWGDAEAIAGLIVRRLRGVPAGSAIPSYTINT